TAGTLLVTGEPRWLGEQVVCSSAVLEPGQAHTLAQGGWVTLTAQHGGAVCVVKQPSRAQRWDAFAAACTAVFRRFSGAARTARRYRSAKPV
ncbi:MAG: hypothetical protein JF626_02955, partial [Polaromonas sp.]|nr:hypothetical protein [Polaromonas sp.]